MVCQPVQRHRWAANALSAVARFRQIGAATLMAYEAAHDAGCAEAALGRTAGQERFRPALLFLVGQPCCRGDLPTRYPARRGDASNAGSVIDQHGAAAALTLRAATVQHGLDAHAVTKDAKQGVAVVENLDGSAVNCELDGQRHRAAWRRGAGGLS